MQPGHPAGVAGSKPAHKIIEIVGMQRQGVGDTDEVEAEVKGLLLYLFGQAHYLHTGQQGVAGIIPQSPVFYVKIIYCKERAKTLYCRRSGVYGD